MTAYEIGQRPDFRRVLFFSQAEDGIRDWSVTGVQTCALPISYAGFCLRSETDPAELQSLTNLVSRVVIGTGRQTAVTHADVMCPSARPPLHSLRISQSHVAV